LIPACTFAAFLIHLTSNNSSSNQKMPKLLVVTHAEVEQLLPMAACIELMEETLASLAREEFHLPLRMVVRSPGAAGLIAMMPAYKTTEPTAYGLKAICVFPGNAARGKDTHQGGVLLFSGETGELLALVNASAITAIRTAAVSGVATRTLSRSDACQLTIIGAGVQARSHLEAIACVRTVERVRVVSRTAERAQQFVREVSPAYSFPLEVAPTVEAALKGADMIVTVTNALEPVLRLDWISPGAHINAVGTFSRATREIDSATMRAASLFVDRRESALNEAGDYLLAAAEGAIAPEHIKAELGEVLVGLKRGRQSADEITLFKSLGLAVEDLAAAEFVFRQAQRQGVGAWTEF
jgi:ornithine cyclodeaminase